VCLSNFIMIGVIQSPLYSPIDGMIQPSHFTTHWIRLKRNNIRSNNTQHSALIKLHSARTTLSITVCLLTLFFTVTLSVAFLHCYTERRCPECHYGECRGAKFEVIIILALISSIEKPFLKGVGERIRF
jgi:hypothetical protein